jgi:hypothetical protein
MTLSLEGIGRLRVLLRGSAQSKIERYEHLAKFVLYFNHVKILFEISLQFFAVMRGSCKYPNCAAGRGEEALAGNQEVMHAAPSSSRGRPMPSLAIGAPCALGGVAPDAIGRPVTPNGGRAPLDRCRGADR